jgi:predicted phage terminase large subunit-like protein
MQRDGLVQEDGELVWRFRGAPVVNAFCEDPAPITGFFGPFGCGKTAAGTAKAYHYVMANPGCRIAIIRETWPALRETTQRTVFRWLPDGLAGEYEKTTHIFHLRTNPPSELVFKGLDDEDDLKNVLSLELSAAWIDEPQGGLSPREDAGTRIDPGVRESLFQGLYGRIGRGPEPKQVARDPETGKEILDPATGEPVMVGAPAMIWLTGNPPSPSHWIAKLFQYPGEGPPKTVYDDKGRPARRLYLGDRSTNAKHLPADYYERLEALYGPGTPMSRRFIYGQWIDFAAEKPFQRTWFLTCGGNGIPPIPALEKLEIAVGFDPAISIKDTACYSALVVAGQEPGGRYTYVLDAERGHWSLWEQIDRLCRAVRRYGARRVSIEDVAYQRALGEVLERELRERGLRVAVDLVKPDLDKLRRAMAWSPLVEDGTVRFAPGLAVLLEAMLGVPQDQTAWDLVDAAGLCIRGFPVRQAEASAIVTEDRMQLRDRAASYAHHSRGSRIIAPRGGWLRPGHERRHQQVARGYAIGARRRAA